MLDSQPAPTHPAGAAEAFGPALPAMERFAQLLATVGVERGLIGPREVDRIWERHLVNCAPLAAVLRGTTVIDLGTGAGLPGIVLAALRPDLTFVLLDANRRRVLFCDEVIAGAGLRNVTTRWARAEDVSGELLVDEVVARAVAPLERLAGWALPLLRPGGRLLAMKGETAADEARRAVEAVRRAGGVVGRVLTLTATTGDPVWVVPVTRARRRSTNRGAGRGQQ